MGVFVLFLSIVIIVLARYCTSLEDRLSDISHIVGTNRKKVVGRVRELNVNLKRANRENERLGRVIEGLEAKIGNKREGFHCKECGCELVKRVFGPDATRLVCSNCDLKRGER